MRAGLARCVLGVALVVMSAPAVSDQTVGLFVNDERAYDGYTLFGTAPGQTVYLINNDGLVVHAWETTYDHRMAYLLENGHLLQVTRGAGGRVQEYDWDGNLVWDFLLDVPGLNPHHDIEPLPGGNVLLIAWETKTVAEAIAAGRDPAELQGDIWPDMIAEIRPLPPSDGEIVWEWHLWDHLVQDFDPTKGNFGGVTDHPELVDVNYGPTRADWTHANGIGYSPDLDQIVLSIRTFSEFWIIDHSTTSEEAAGHSGGNSGMGGDVLYCWGNPAVYRRGTIADQQLFGQHDTQWIPPGYPGEWNIILFNNGSQRPEGTYSSIEEIVPPVDQNGLYAIDPGAPFAPPAPIWSYTATPPETLYSSAISGVQRQPNGTTLACEGTPGHFFEVTHDKVTVWDYLNSVGTGGAVEQGAPVPTSNRVFKIRRYPPGYPAFEGRDLTPGDPVERFIAPWPVPEGSLAVSQLGGPGTSIQIDWDASTCTSFDYHLLFGDLAEVSTHHLPGAECNLGPSGTYVWSDVPPGSVYFIVVGTDETGVYESSWGRDGAGSQRNGTTASFQCGTTTKVISSVCP